MPIRKHRPLPPEPTPAEIADARSIVGSWLGSRKRGGASEKPAAVVAAYKVCGNWLAHNIGREPKVEGGLQAAKTNLARVRRTHVATTKSALTRLATFPTDSLPKGARVFSRCSTNRATGRTWTTAWLEVQVHRYRVTRGKAQQRTIKPTTPWRTVPETQFGKLPAIAQKYLRHMLPRPSESQHL